jgi:hypothetical protein
MYPKTHCLPSSIFLATHPHPPPQIYIIHLIRHAANHAKCGFMVNAPTRQSELVPACTSVRSVQILQTCVVVGFEALVEV